MKQSANHLFLQIPSMHQGGGVAVIQGGRDFSMAVPVFRLKRESPSQKTLAFIVAMLSFIDINFYVHV